MNNDVVVELYEATNVSTTVFSSFGLISFSP